MSIEVLYITQSGEILSGLASARRMCILVGLASLTNYLMIDPECFLAMTVVELRKYPLTSNTAGGPCDWDQQWTWPIPK